MSQEGGPVVKPADMPTVITEMTARLAALEAVRSEKQDKKADEVHEVFVNKKKRKSEEEEVDFTTIDNKMVSIKKLKRTRNKTPEEARDLVRQAEELLTINNVKITKDNITVLGIGGTNASKYRTK